MVRYKGSSPAEIIYTSSDIGLTVYFVYVSGEDIELAKAEVDTLLNQFPENIGVHWQGRLARITSSSNPSKYLLQRAALVQMAGTILYESDKIENLTNSFSDDEWMKHISTLDEFSVNTLCVGCNNDMTLRLQIEQVLGRHIKNVTSAKVNLKAPSIQIQVFIFPEQFLVCKFALSEIRPLLRMRNPGKKTFFHPSMMNSILARVMCNLAGIKPGEVVLDPFCGGGGILCEASYIGAHVVGIDLNWKLLVGAVRNLQEISENYSIIQGDSQHIPINNINRIVTDPPYGRASSTRGNKAIELVESMLMNIDSILQTKGESCCFCVDSEMKISQTIQDLGLTIGRLLKMRVHRGLLREIVTLKL
jgi:tRNA (guanine10-N2)-dimethyltransferase